MQACLKKDVDKGKAEMEESIWPHEIEGIMNLKTWAYAQEIIHGGKVQGMGNVQDGW